MDGGFGEKLNTILSDAETMEKISRIASGLSEGSAENKNALPDGGKPFAENPLISGKAAFISALRPMLREEKRKKLDSLQTALTVAEMFGKSRKR